MTRVTAVGKESASNFSPDNGTGLVVRTAIKDVLESLRTINSASGDPSGAANLAAYQMHIDSDTDTLKIRNGANSDFVVLGDVSATNLGLLPKSGGSMTGVLGLINATESAPSIHFGDTTTGLYRKGANQIGLTFSGTEKLFFDQNGLTVKNQLEIRFSEQTGNGSNYVAVKSPSALAGNLTLTLPTTNPAVAGYALISTDTSGTLSWGVAGGAKGNGDQVFFENDKAVTGSYTITNNKNAGTFGPITINNGVTVTVGAGENWTIV